MPMPPIIKHMHRGRMLHAYIYIYIYIEATSSTYVYLGKYRKVQNWDPSKMVFWEALN
jgi:hypothetical protein